MAATLDDILAAVAHLETATVAYTQISNSLLADLLTEAKVQTAMLATVANVAQSQQQGGTNPKPNPTPKPPKTPPAKRGLLRRLGDWIGGTGAQAITTAGGPGAGLGLAGMVAGGLAKLSGPLGPLGAFAGGLVNAAKALETFSAQQEEVSRRLAQVSPSQAAIIAQLDMQRTLRELQLGEDTAGTARIRAESTDKAEQAAAPWDKRWTDFKNLFAANFQEVKAAVLDFRDPFKAIQDLMVKIMSGKSDFGNNETFLDWLERVEAKQKVADDAARKRIEAARKADERRRDGK